MSLIEHMGKVANPDNRSLERPTSPMQAGPSNLVDSAQSSTDGERSRRSNDAVPSKQTALEQHYLESTYQLPSIRSAVNEANKAFEAIELYLQLEQLDLVARIYQELDRPRIPHSSNTSQNNDCTKAWNILRESVHWEN